jgi:hypothetical protein
MKNNVQICFLHIQSEMFYFRSLKIAQHDIFVVLVVIEFFLLGYFLVGWFQYYSHEYCWICGYVACFLNLSFDVLYVICRLRNLRSPFKIPFYLVPSIVFSFWARAYFTLGPYAAFHGMALTCHIERSMITAIWTHQRMFQNSKLYQFMLNVEFCISRC